MPLDFRERDVVMRRDGQREHGAVGEDGAGLSSVGTVETLSAENDFHGCRRVFCRFRWMAEPTWLKDACSIDGLVVNGRGRICCWRVICGDCNSQPGKAI